VIQEEMTIIKVVDGTLVLKDQLRDYSFRGEALTCMNFLEFMLETYEDSKDRKDEEIGSNSAIVDDIPRTRGPGRPPSTRIPYQDEAGKGKRCRVKRSPDHETLPRIVGKWFCRRDNEFEKDLFRGSMLMLLKPWRKITDLKTTTETFQEAYDTFTSQADEQSHRVIANVQYYYECSDGAKAERKKMSSRTNDIRPDDDNTGAFDIEVGDDVEIEDIYAVVAGELKEITDEDIEREEMMKTHARDRLYGESAVALGYDFGIFDESDENTKYPNTARKIQDDEGEKIRTWEAQLKTTTREQINKYGVTDVTEGIDVPILSANIAQPVLTIDPNTRSDGETSTGHEGQVHVERVELAKLNEDQRRAHDIVEARLKEHMASEY
jgi:hypothetical protein